MPKVIRFNRFGETGREPPIQLCVNPLFGRSSRFMPQAPHVGIRQQYFAAAGLRTAYVHQGGLGAPPPPKHVCARPGNVNLFEIR